MTQTRFYDDHTVVVPGRVAAYDRTDDGHFTVDWSTSFDSVGAGGVMSTVSNLVRWDQNFYDSHLGKGTLLHELQARGAHVERRPYRAREAGGRYLSRR